MTTKPKERKKNENETFVKEKTHNEQMRCGEFFSHGKRGLNTGVPGRDGRGGNFKFQSKQGFSWKIFHSVKKEIYS